MINLFKEYLFTQHYLVNDGIETDEYGRQTESFTDPEHLDYEEAMATIVTLAQKFGIRIVGGFEYASKQLIRNAANYIGEYVPEPFYRGFPQSVLELTTNQKIYDQLNGFGWWHDIQHSTLENIYERVAFNENVKKKEFTVITDDEAKRILTGNLRDILGKTSRPLNPEMNEIMIEGWRAFGEKIVPEKILCKRTAVMLFCESKNPVFLKNLEIPDAIRILEYIQYTAYRSEKLNELNLRNKDRKLIATALDILFGKILADDFDSLCAACFEKRAIWCGMLHHLHYKPKVYFAEVLIKRLREGPNFSAMSTFETLMRQGHTVGAARYLKDAKGSGVLIRNLNYILSRCKTDEEIEEVFQCLE